MHPYLQNVRFQTRRHFLKQAPAGLGAIALSGLLGRPARSAETAPSDNPNAPRPPQFPARAKHVIYLHMSGAPPSRTSSTTSPCSTNTTWSPAPTPS